MEVNRKAGVVFVIRVAVGVGSWRFYCLGLLLVHSAGLSVGLLVDLHLGHLVLPLVVVLGGGGSCAVAAGKEPEGRWKEAAWSSRKGEEKEGRKSGWSSRKAEAAAARMARERS